MKKLIISPLTYNWIKSCAGLVQRDPENFTVLILFRDDERPIVDCVNLCKKAVHEQRVYDLFRLGKELGVKKIINLNYDEDNIDIEKLIIQLQLYITIGGVTEVYFQPIDFLTNVLVELSKKSNVSLYSFFDCDDEETIVRKMVLDEGEMTRKFMLCNLMIGINSLCELPSHSYYEKFYQVKQ